MQLFVKSGRNVLVYKQEENDVLKDPDQYCKSRYILVADSHIDSLFYTSILLQRFGYYPHIAKTAREAFIAATTATPSLIITALDLADLSGLDFIRLLRKNFTVSNIPFITLRKADDFIEEHQCFSAGAAGCLTKPVSAEILYRVVQKAIETAQGATIRIRVIQNKKAQHAPPD
jgi:two-component system chemotaxis response regulator CheY